MICVFWKLQYQIPREKFETEPGFWRCVLRIPIQDRIFPWEFEFDVKNFIGLSSLHMMLNQCHDLKVGSVVWFKTEWKPTVCKMKVVK